MAKQTTLATIGMTFLILSCLGGTGELLLVFVLAFVLMQGGEYPGWATAEEKTARLRSLVFLSGLFVVFLFIPGTITIFFELLFGWIFFLGHVLPRARMDVIALAIALVCMVVFAVGLQLTGSMFVNRKVTEDLPARRWPFRWTAAIGFGTALLFITGLAAVGILESGKSLWELRK